MLVTPVWLQTVGFGGVPSVPYVGVQNFVGHVVYGVVLGAAYAALTE